MTCRACELLAKNQPLDGVTHTCDASGTSVAVLAHEAGAVSEPTRIPHFDVAIHFTIQAFDEDDVKAKLVPLVTDLLDDEDVLDAAFTVTAK